MSLARLVLNKSILVGLRVVIRDELAGSQLEGTIQRYDDEHDCFLLLDESSSLQHAVQFHQFTVEEEQRQLVLKVTSCTRVRQTADGSMPARPSSTGADDSVSHEQQEVGAAGSAGRISSDSSSTAATPCQVSAQLSEELSQQLSGLVGRAFSHTEEGFEVLVPASTLVEVQAAAAADSGLPAAKLLPSTAPMAVPGCPASDAAAADEEGLYWGSPVKHESAAMAAAAAAALAAAADSQVQQQDGSLPSSSLQQEVDPAAVAVAEPEMLAEAAAASPVLHDIEGDAEQSCEQSPASAPPSTSTAATAAALGIPAAATPAASFSSFKEISRMISTSESSACHSHSNSRRGSRAGLGVPNMAARLLDEGGTWGTPREGSSWGTPREQHPSSEAAACSQHDTAEDAVAARLAARSRRCSSDADNAAHLALQAKLEAAAEQRQQQQQQQQSESDAGSSAEIPSSIRQAAAAAEPAAGVPPTYDQLDFTIAAAVDVQPMQALRNSRRNSRELYRIPSSDATDAGMMVDIPQPLSSRRVSRTSVRTMHMPSDPGYAYGMAHLPGSSGGGNFSSSVGGAPELRRAASNSISGISSRRMSRNTSSRINADQDWGITGPDGQLLPQPMQSGGGAAFVAQAGMPLHMPGPGSRRTSRTLSGRLPPDQDGAAVVTQLGDAEPDVLARPLTATSMALDTIVSRRTSANGRPGTPDSDGFGYSEFEGEPLVPPELAQWDAIAEEAAHAAADSEAAAVAAATAAVPGHQRHQRRSVRNMPFPAASPAVAPARVGARLSDQDEQMPAAAAGIGVAGGPGSISSSRLMQPTLSSCRLSQIAEPAQAEAEPTEQQEQQGAASSKSIGTEAAAAAAAGAEHAQVTDGEGSSTAGSRPGSGNMSRKGSSRRTMSGILQAAAAVAAAAEAAAAAAVGFALGGRSTADEQQAGQETAAAEATAKPDGNSAAAAAAVASQDGIEAVPPAADRKDKLLQDSFAIHPVDSFNCPPFIPMAGASISGKSSLNPFAGTGSGQLHSMNSASSSNGNVAAFHIGTAVDPEPAGSCTPAAIQQLQQQLQESGSPSAATAAMLRKGQLLPPAASVEGSEWGSGALLGPHITSGIDSPTGSAVFQANSFEAGSECGSLPGAGSELAAAFESLATTGTGAKAGIGASRMGREAAGAAATVLPFAGYSTPGSASTSIHEIVPANSDSDSDSERIAASYYRRRSSGDMHHHSRLAVESHEEPGGDSCPATQQPEGLELGFGEQQGIEQHVQTVGFEQQQAVGFEQQQALGFEQQQALGFEQEHKQQQGLGFGQLGFDNAQGIKDLDDTASLGFGHRQMLGFGERSSKEAKSGLLGFAAAHAAAAAAAAAGVEANIRSASSGGSSSACPLPPTYSESVAGVDADDERSSAGTSPRRVWPANYAHSAAAAAAAGRGDDSGTAVRHAAELTEQQQQQQPQQQQAAATAAQSEAEVRISSRQLQADESAAAAAVLNSSSTGLVRRSVSRPMSRTPSQIMPAGSAAAGAGAVCAPMSVDGMVQLPTPGYEYADDDSQPLMPHMMGYAVGQVPGALAAAQTQVGRVALHTLLANSAQWFDLLVFVVLGGQLAAAMAPPQLTQHQQLGLLFAIFAAGHVLWLAGCFVWPWMSARLGRKTVLAWTVGLSAFPTALLGCMPTNAEGGAAGIAIIAILRFLAGFSLNNEAPAALAYLTEHAPQFPSLHASLVPCSIALGALGASLAGLFFAWVLSPGSLGVFGWRLALAMSLVANAVSGGLRGYVLQDAEAGMSAADLGDRRNDHTWRVIRYHPLQVLLAMALQAFAVCGLYLLAAWLPVHFVQLTQLPASLGLTVHTINMAVLAGSIPMGGFLADKYGRTSMLLSTSAAAAMFAYPAWLLFSLSEAGVSWFSQFTLVAFVGLHWGALASLLVEQFPKGVRASALTLAFTLPMVLLGCTAPLIALGFIHQTHSLASPAILMILSAVVSGGTVLALELRKVD